MRVLVVGGGGREHTVIRKLKENPEISQIFAKFLKEFKLYDPLVIQYIVKYFPPFTIFNFFFPTENQKKNINKSCNSSLKIY